MKRRSFFSVCGAGLAAGYVNTGRADAFSPVGGQFEAPGPNTQRVVLRAVGLHAFIPTIPVAQTGVETALDIVGLDSTGFELPGRRPMHGHTPFLVIATENLADPSVGTEATNLHLQKWRLRTTTTKFRFWDLTKKTLSLENIQGPDLAIGVYGAVPLKRLNPALTTINWASKSVVSSKLHLTKGLITDEVSRVYPSNVQRRKWRFTSGAFGSTSDLQVTMTDTIRIELNATTASPAGFKIEGFPAIATKGTWVEAYLVTLPHQLLAFEIQEFHTLHHVRVAYKLADQEFQEPILPKSDPNSFVGEEPVFCPPAWF